MLTIRRDQMRALGKHREAAFNESLVLYVKETFSHLSAEAEHFVRTAREKAANYKLSGMRDITRFVELCAAVGLDFDRQPSTAWVKAALLDTGISDPSERLRVAIAEHQRRVAVKQHNARVRLPAPPALPTWAR
jgi:hypothetical protein